MNTTLRTTAVAIFTERASAEHAAESLRAAGFDDWQIGLTEDGAAARHPGTPAAHLTGGAGFGMLVGALAGLVTGTLPGLVAGAAAGGVLGAVAGLGLPAAQSRYYQRQLGAGRVLITVQTDHRYEEAVDLLRRHGGCEARPPQRRAGAGMLP